MMAKINIKAAHCQADDIIVKKIKGARKNLLMLKKLGRFKKFILIGSSYGHVRLHSNVCMLKVTGWPEYINGIYKE